MSYLESWNILQSTPGVCRNPNVQAWQRKPLGPSGVVATFNPSHLSTKRPQSIASDGELKVLRPFNAAGFHFGSASSREVVARVQISSGDVSEDCFASFASGGAVASGGAAVGDSSQCNDCSASSTVADAVPDNEHPILINVSPIFPGHGLFVPYVGRGLPQAANAELITLCLRLARLFAAGQGRPDARLGFNSLAAFASVNHAHFHLAFARDIFHTGRFACELASRSPSIGNRVVDDHHQVSLYRSAWHLPGFVACLEPCGGPSSAAAPSSKAFQALGSITGRLVEFMASELAVPHHFLVADGGAAVYIFPRLPQRPSCDGRAQVALAEVCGLAIFNEASAYGDNECNSAMAGVTNTGAGATAAAGPPQVSEAEWLAELASFAVAADVLARIEGKAVGLLSHELASPQAQRWSRT